MLLPVSPRFPALSPCSRWSVAVLGAMLLPQACQLASGQDKTAAGSPAQPATVKPAPADSNPGDYSREALVFDKLATRIRMEADGTGTRQTTAVVRIFADAGVKQMAVLTFTYTASNQQMDIDYVRVRKPDGTVVVTPDYNVQDMPADVTREAPMYSDIHQKHVAVKGLGVGDTLEYQVTQRTLKPEVPGQFWLDYTFEKNLVLLDEEFDLDVPADKTVTVASTDVQPQVTTANGRKLYHWASSNLARPDPDAPPKSTRNWKPSLQVTTFTTWQQVGDWYESLQQQPLAITPAIQARADQLTRGLTTDDEKLRAIFNEVALHIHYVGLEFGIGRYQPHPADDVLSNEYGDCKDKHTLLASLLKAAGIQAWPVLISTSRELDPKTPSPAQFDHVITLVPLDGKLIWMDSTEEVAPIGTLMATIRDKQALAIPAGKPAYLERTPVDLPYQQSAEVRVEGKLSDQGVFTGHFVQTYHGDVEMLIRAAFRSVPQSQWKELIQRFSNSTGFAGEVKTPDVSPIEQTSQPFQFSYDYTREKYGEWEERRISPPMPPVGWELAPGVKQIKPADDVEIGSPGDQLYSATVQLPAGWAVIPPRNVDLKESWAEYRATYSFKNGAYTAERRVVTRQNKVPLDQWDKYLAFRRAIYADEVQMTPIISGKDAQAFQNKLNSDVAVAPATTHGRSVVTLSGEAREQLLSAVQPLRDAIGVLEADPGAGPDDLTRAVDLSRKSVEEIEAKTLTLPSDDAHSLYWGQVLAFAWCTRGWAALETHDLATAEAYLRAAWRLGQDRMSGFQLGRAFEAEGKKTAAAHQYELAHATGVENPLGGFLGSSDNLDDRIASGYQRVTGRELRAASLNHGQYDGSLRAELDKDEEIRQIAPSTKLTGSGLYAVAFEDGKPVRVNLLHGDKGFEGMTTTLQSHAFPPELPSGSKARLLREVRLVCTPWSGCDAYLLLPTSIEIPSLDVTPEGAPAGMKTVRVEVAPQ
ncbi:MAG TPA: DUF3857 and transglutaminase domain-containing protein [Terracidiphilus sp.]|nr:DUF3857 and transglutaminase domain-containing protein [Terracidiphilus sp.]